MAIFFIQEQLLPICVVLMACSLDLNKLALNFSTALLSLECCNYGTGLWSVSWWGLWIYCLSFWDVNLVHRRSNRLHTWDPAEHLCFVNPCKFRTLAKFIGWLQPLITGMIFQLT